MLKWQRSVQEKRSVTAYRRWLYGVVATLRVHTFFLCLKVQRFVVSEWLWVELRGFEAQEERWLDLSCTCDSCWSAWGMIKTVLNSIRKKCHVCTQYHREPEPNCLWHQLPDKRNNPKRPLVETVYSPFLGTWRFRAYFVTWWRWLRCELATWLDHAVPIRACKLIVVSRALLHTARMWFGCFWAVIITDLLRLNSWFARKRHGDDIVSGYPERQSNDLSTYLDL